jgi:hypothetical protein
MQLALYAALAGPSWFRASRMSGDLALVSEMPLIASHDRHHQSAAVAALAYLAAGRSRHAHRARQIAG